MSDELNITLRLDRAECTRGESVLFEVVLENTSRARIDGLPALDPEYETVRLVLDGPGGRKVGSQLSPRLRDGAVAHPERGEPRTLNLGPGERRTLNGDLLDWFGELEPGSYEVFASHFSEAVSTTVTLKVQPAAPLLLSTPRYGLQSPIAGLGAGWVHKAAAQHVAFWQQYSPALPCCLVHGVRAAELKEAPSEFFASLQQDDRATSGHLFWVVRDRLYVGAADTKTLRPTAGVELKTPFKATLLASPLSLPGGGVLIPLVDAKRERFAVMQLASDGAVQTQELDLGKAKPIGPHVCFWEYASRLHFAWTTPGGREIQTARLLLDDLAAGFTTRAVDAGDDPILWLEGYLDADASAKQTPIFEEQIPPDRRGEPIHIPPPKVMLWCVARSAVGLRCLRVSVADGQARVGATLPAADIADPRVVAGVVTYENELAVLIADAKDGLFYGSTARGEMAPLAQVAGQTIALDQQPGLLRASIHGRAPWVYLRYIKDRKLIDFVKLEPAGRPDPMETRDTGRAARMSRRT